MRDGAEKDRRTRDIEEAELKVVRQDLQDQKKILSQDVYRRAQSLLIGQVCKTAPVKSLVKQILNADNLAEVEPAKWLEMTVADEGVNLQLEQLAAQLKAKHLELDELFEAKRKKAHSR